MSKPLTEAERSYLKRLNQEAFEALQRHQEAQQRLIQCVAFLREQHDAPEDKWKLEDLVVGFVQNKAVLSDIVVEKEWQIGFHLLTLRTQIVGGLRRYTLTIMTRCILLPRTVPTLTARSSL